jgi:asparagine synthase (glutamine-hydrolysing)
MCGIAGIIHFSQLPIEEASINYLTDALAHRGPDGRGVWFNDNHTVALGHRRLSILDLTEAGSQPMPDASRRYWIVFNGEIYNFLEIAKDLRAEGYHFQSNSDTEVILAAYHAWGEKMLHSFNGMWAIALYDTQTHTLWLSRDRFGVKPLYYYKDDKRLIFASEIQAIHKILGKNHPLNTDVVGDVLLGKPHYHGTIQTYLKNVYALPAGYQLKIENNQTKINSWYELPRVQVPQTFEEQALILRELCIDACKLRLRSDVPVGTCLSGGLDSGSITAMINQLQPEDSRFGNYTHQAFCVSFPHSSLDEGQDALALAHQLGSKIDIINVNSPNPTTLEQAMRTCDGFMHSLAFYPIWELYRYIKAHGITVTLDGQGPDEMLGGYTPVYEGLSAALQKRSWSWFWDVYDTYSSTGDYEGFSAKENTQVALKELIRNKGRNLFRSLKAPQESLLKPVRSNSQLFDNELDKSLYNQFFYMPLLGILNQYDRCSMASGVECRMPFMDYRIVEFVFSLPPQSKVGGGYTKRVLREAMKGIVPDETRLRKRKIGFNAPIVEWFRGDLKDWLLAEMNQREFLENDFFNGKQIKQDFEKFIKNSQPHWHTAWQVWSPVHFAWWQRQIKQTTY